MWCRTGSGMHGRSVLHKLKSHNFHQNEWSKFKNIYRTWNLASQTWMEAFVRFELKSCERRGPLTRNSKLRHESRVRQNVETWCQVFFVRHADSTKQLSVLYHTWPYFIHRFGVISRLTYSHCRSNFKPTHHTVHLTSTLTWRWSVHLLRTGTWYTVTIEISPISPVASTIQCSTRI